MRYEIIGIRAHDDKHVLLAHAWTEQRAWNIHDQCEHLYGSLYKEVVVDYPWWSLLLMKP